MAGVTVTPNLDDVDLKTGKHDVKIAAVHIWFVLHITNGRITALQEHDMREGGHLMPRSPEEFKAYARKNIPYRIGGTDALVERILGELY